MSEKRLASEKTVQAFIRAVYPESTELCMTVNSEEDVLREATRLILGRRAPDPEKQELVEALKALTYSAGETYAVAEWLNREAQCVKIGYDPLFEVPGNVVPLANSIDYKRAKEDWDRARALLHRYEEEKP